MSSSIKHFTKHFRGSGYKFPRFHTMSNTSTCARIIFKRQADLLLPTSSILTPPHPQSFRIKIGRQTLILEVMKCGSPDQVIKWLVLSLLLYDIYLSLSLFDLTGDQINIWDFWTSLQYPPPSYKHFL